MNATNVLIDAAGIVNQLSVSSAVINNLPSQPGYNGSVLMIDDEEAARVGKCMDEAIIWIEGRESYQRSVIDGLRADLATKRAAGDGQEAVPELPELVAWRNAHKVLEQATATYNAALIAARRKDEVKGFGHTSVDDEFQAMTRASNAVFALVRPLLDALLSAPTSPPPAAPAVPEIDYQKLIADCYASTKQAQGTKGCIQFAKGAEWFREQIAAPRPKEPTNDNN